MTPGFEAGLRVPAEAVPTSARNVRAAAHPARRARPRRVSFVRGAAAVLIGAAIVTAMSAARADVMAVFVDGTERTVGSPTRGQAGRAAWTAAVVERGGVISTDDFNGVNIDVPVDSVTSVGNFSVYFSQTGGYSPQAGNTSPDPHPTGIFVGTTGTGGGANAETIEGLELRFDTQGPVTERLELRFDPPIHAWAADVYSVDGVGFGEDGSPTSNDHTTLHVLDHSFDLTEILPYAGSGYMGFFGIVSDVPFDTISITAEGDGDRFRLDNVSIASVAENALSQEAPIFEVDPSWPKPLPYNWTYGHVPSIAVDSRDHVFILTRPNTLPEDVRARAAPPVIELDPDGNFVNGWGGPSDGYDWPDSEHGIAIDFEDNVWIGGSAPVAPSLRELNDDMLLKFTRDGEFLLQIGGRDASPTSRREAGGNRDGSSVHQSADAAVYRPTNELFVADGYGNRRVAVFDATTGAFKRAWGAFGNEPIDVIPEARVVGEAAARPAGGNAGRARRLDTDGDGPPQFGSPVHAIKVSNDGKVYVADRSNRRIQVFTIDGEYEAQMFLNREGPSTDSAAGLAFSPDPEQRFLYVADYGNSRIAVVDRQRLEVLYQFGERSPEPGNFQGLHHLAVDSQGNIYTGEVAPGARVQKFRFVGMSRTLPAAAETGR